MKLLSNVQCWIFKILCFDATIKQILICGEPLLGHYVGHGFAHFYSTQALNVLTEAKKKETLLSIYIVFFYKNLYLKLVWLFTEKELDELSVTIIINTSNTLWRF